MSEKRYWGKHGEYGPYSAQADGWPNRGEVLKDWRKKKKLSSRFVGHEYGMRVRGKPVSERWVTMAEKHNVVPHNEHRRKVLAQIVGIPLILFGLGDPKELLLEANPTTSAPTKDTLTNLVSQQKGLKDYNQFLQLYWQLDYTSTAQNFVVDIVEMIQALHSSALQVGGSRQTQVYEMLCGFYPLASTIYNDQRNYTQAFKYADDCVTLADNMNNNKMRAVALYQRGFINLQMGTQVPDQVDHTSVNAAVTDFQTALPLAVPRLEAAILLDLALAQALVKQRRTAVSSIEKAGKIISKGKLEDGTFVDLFANLSTGRYNLGKAAALVVLKEYDEAESELDIADEKISSDQTRRHAWIDILRAQVYFRQGSYPIATELAQNTLKVCKSIHSANNIHLIKNLHTQLSSDQCSYRHNRAVSELGSLLVLP